YSWSGEERVPSAPQHLGSEALSLEAGLQQRRLSRLASSVDSAERDDLAQRHALAIACSKLSMTATSVMPSTCARLALPSTPISCDATPGRSSWDANRRLDELLKKPGSPPNGVVATGVPHDIASNTVSGTSMEPWRSVTGKTYTSAAWYQAWMSGTNSRLRITPESSSVRTTSASGSVAVLAMIRTVARPSVASRA